MAEIASLQQDYSTNEEKTEMSNDGRPKLAVGHVNLEVEDVDDACAFFVRHGMRDIFKGEDFGQDHRTRDLPSPDWLQARVTPWTITSREVRTIGDG